jgi:DNA repair protein RecN (Recombination protein N)
MLQRLDIRNVVLIEQLGLDFGPGLHVFTGETGSGKSIVLDALGLALGSRADASLVRHGAQQAVVGASFAPTADAQEFLEENGLVSSEDGSIHVRRMLDAGGKGKAFINDMGVTVTLLRELGEMLLEVHGQHDQRGLTDVRIHRQLLDAYGQHGELVKAMRESWRTWQNAKQALADAMAMQEKLRAEEDYLRHVLGELDALAPEEGEEEQLAERRRQMMLAEKRGDSLKDALASLSQPKSVVQMLASAERILTRRSEEDAALAPVTTALEQAMLHTQEVTDALESLLREDGYDAAELERAESRLFELRDAARKHHCLVDELPAKHRDLREQLGSLEHGQQQCDALQKIAAEGEQAYRKAAEALSKARAASARKLEARVMEELPPLNMASARFTVAIKPLPEATGDGLEMVEFHVAANPGQPSGPLAKVASGGELSRLMLSLKLALAEVDGIPSMVFDEIDTGVGGATAEAIGKRLAQLGKHRQVLVVTHQPQVAAFAQRHFVVSKQHDGDKTHTSVRVLDEEGRREELARMLSGASVTDQARAAADALLELAA